MREVTIEHTAHGQYVPSRGGVGGFVWQPDVTVITAPTGARIVIEDTQVRISGVDVSDETPATAQTHDAVAAYWFAKTRELFAAPTAEVIQVSAFEIDGHQVDAPGFERAQFQAFVQRAMSAQLRTFPGGHKGEVLVQSGSSDARYVVSRTHCSCQGHHGHGRCYHRALAIYLADVAGVDICHVPTIGFSPRGVSLTTGRKPAAA